MTFLFAWIETWPNWIKMIVIVFGGTAMVVHFLAWLAWLFLTPEDPDNVVPFRKRDER